jgi:hypothetical protein
MGGSRRAWRDRSVEIALNCGEAEVAQRQTARSTLGGAWQLSHGAAAGDGRPPRN